MYLDFPDKLLLLALFLRKEKWMRLYYFETEDLEVRAGLLLLSLPSLFIVQSVCHRHKLTLTVSEIHSLQSTVQRELVIIPA